jgi:hypothetical protein
MEMLPVKELTIPQAARIVHRERSWVTVFGPGFGAHQSKDLTARTCLVVSAQLGATRRNEAWVVGEPYLTEFTPDELLGRSARDDNVNLLVSFNAFQLRRQLWMTGKADAD